jgi:hypothetical protein
LPRLFAPVLRAAFFCAEDLPVLGFFFFVAMLLLLWWREMRRATTLRENTAHT